MKKVYIVLSYSGTILSRLIKLYTHKEYSHVSISLDEKLESMYSFGRINAYIPFIGGFVQESPNFGTFKRFKNTKTKIYSMEISDEDYKKIKEIIKEFNDNKKNYKFNVLGLIAVMAHYRLKRENFYYCAEFVKHVFDSSGVDLELPDIVKPDDFQNIRDLCEIYTGKLHEYPML